MRHFKLLPAAIVLFISIVFIRASHSSAAVAMWNGFDSDPAAEMDSHFAQIREDGVPMGIGGPTEFDRFDVSCSADSVRWYQDRDQIRTQDFFPDIHIYQTPCTMPHEPLISSMNFRPSNGNSDLQPASGPAEDSVSAYDSDCAKNMRIPSPASLVLVAIGLLSLRFTTRRWRF
jgi:hypothetical protein